MKIKGRIFQLVMLVIFFILGVILTYQAIKFLVEDARYGKTTATVISAEVGYSDDGKLTAVSTYEYFIDGERYVKKTAVQSANSAKFEGETFTVKYDPDDPATVKGDSATPVALMAFGLIFTCAGGGLAIGLVTGKLN